MRRVFVCYVTPRLDFGGNSGGSGKNLGEVQQSSSRPPWNEKNMAAISVANYEYFGLIFAFTHI
jgi:hypothetical protein